MKLSGLAHRLGAALLVGAAVGGVVAVAARADQVAVAAPKTVRAGVYTAEQAARGMKPYIRNCSSCHGELFNGGESGPALSGEAFMGRWAGQTMADFQEKLLSMPPYPDTPGKLGDQVSADIAATLLSVNARPPGPNELSADMEQLRAITID